MSDFPIKKRYIRLFILLEKSITHQPKLVIVIIKLIGLSHIANNQTSTIIEHTAVKADYMYLKVKFSKFLLVFIIKP